MAFGDVTGTDTSKLEARIAELEVELDDRQKGLLYWNNKAIELKDERDAERKAHEATKASRNLIGQESVEIVRKYLECKAQLTKTRTEAVAACLELKLRITAEPPQMWPDDESWRDQHTRCVQAAGEFEGRGDG